MVGPCSTRQVPSFGPTSSGPLQHPAHQLEDGTTSGLGDECREWRVRRHAEVRLDDADLRQLGLEDRPARLGAQLDGFDRFRAAPTEGRDLSRCPGVPHPADVTIVSDEPALRALFHEPHRC